MESNALLFVAIFIGVVAFFVLVSLIVAFLRNKKKDADKEDKDIYKFDKRPLSKRDEDEIDQAGKKAENEVSILLREIADQYGCILYEEDICLEDGQYSIEVDHLFLTKGGLFVIETKGNKGTIYGDKQDKVWIAKKPNGKQKKLKNPVLQTSAHVKFITYLCNDFCPKLNPLVIFPYADISKITTCTVHNLSSAKKRIVQACQSNKYDDHMFQCFDGKIKRMIEKHSITKEEHLLKIHKRFG